MQRFYTAIIEKASKGYGVFFPDLPGCTSFGETVEKAAANAFVAAQAHAALAGEYGEKLPAPRAPDQIPAERGARSARPHGEGTVAHAVRRDCASGNVSRSDDRTVFWPRASGDPEAENRKAEIAERSLYSLAFCGNVWCAN